MVSQCFISALSYEAYLCTFSNLMLLLYSCSRKRANGCTWSEALEMSGVAPGDLTRIIGRAMDAVRQFGNLKYYPLRKDDIGGTATVDPLKRGIHPELRKLCREAAQAMNRYPVKDTLPFEAEEEDMFDETAEEEESSESNDEITKVASNETPEDTSASTVP